LSLRMLGDIHHLPFYPVHCMLSAVQIILLHSKAARLMPLLRV